MASRRQLLMSSTVGSLLGAAWGASFLKAEMPSNEPGITVYRTPDLFSMMIELKPVRVLLLDGTDVDALYDAVDGTAGFLRQRLDVVIASHTLLHRLPAGYLDRWNVSYVFAAPDSGQPLAEPIADRAITVGDLSISSHPVPAGAWLRQSPAVWHPWFMEIRYRRSSCIYCSSMELMLTVRPRNDTIQSMSLTNDTTSDVVTNGSTDIVAVPAEIVESSSAPTVVDTTRKLVRLYRGYPVSIGLTKSSVNVPAEFMID